MSLPRLDLCLDRRNLVLAHANPAFRARAAQYLRRQGWAVRIVESASEVHRLVRQLPPDLVLLATRLPDESGWLTCDKLVREDPQTRVLLMDAAPSEADHQFAEFVGAVGLIEEGDPDALALGGDVERILQAAG